MLSFRIDTYNWGARVFPVYLTLAPAVLAIAAILPEGLNLPLRGGSAIILLAILSLMGQVASDFGKRREPRLWDTWGGPPTTRFLRHGNTEFNYVVRSQIHASLRSAGLSIPTVEEEARDPDSALALYGAAVDHLRQRTRDAERFPLVHKTNIEYGARRNLLGMKPFGLGIVLLSIAVPGWAVFHAWSRDETILPVATVVTIINVGVAIIWLVGVRAANLRIVADRYAHRLLEAALDLGENA